MEKWKMKKQGRMRSKKRNRKSEAESSSRSVIIPEEIVVEILSRLPLCSLARFSYISKQWHSLISDISVTKTGPPTVLLLSNSKVYSFSPHSIDQHQQEVQVKSVYVPWGMKKKISYSRRKILGSCNGLLLMRIDEDLFLWNPLTTFFKKVLTYCRLCDDGYNVCSGLCYDSTCDEYKAVLALSHETPDYGGEFVVVGSFRSKSWTNIDDIPYMVLSMYSGPVFNGNLHWFASKNDIGTHFLKPHQIIYFNACMEKFEEVPMPNPRGEDRDIICGLGILDGYLCMSRPVCPGNIKNNFEVLTMKEYGVKNSWTILFTVSHGLSFYSGDTLVPLGYTKNGEIITEVCLLEELGDWHIRAFNLTDNSHRRIQPVDSFFRGIAYEESLITPTDYGWEEEEEEEEEEWKEPTYIEFNYRIMKKGKDGEWTTEYMDRFFQSDSE